MWKLNRLAVLIGLAVAASAAIWWIYLDRGHWPAQLQKAVAQSVHASPANTGWARIAVQGRDVILQGEAPDTGALHEMRRRILSTPGVSNVIVQTRLRVWGTLTKPTVTRLATQDRRPDVEGTWPANAAEGLSVELAGNLYVLGQSEDLKTRGSRWTLAPSEDLPDGRYDVEVTVWSAELSASDQSNDELTVDTVAPSAPKVDRYHGRSLTPRLSGTWPIQEAAKLLVEVAGKTYELGEDRQLTTSSAGRWQLDVDVELQDGENEVKAIAFDHVGNAQHDATRDEAYVDRDPPHPPTVDRFESSRSFTLQGTWAEGDAVGLEVRVAGQTYLMGQDKGLVSMGQGRWRLTPKFLPAEGVYDVVVRSHDRAGNVSEDTTKDELLIRYVPERDISHALEETPRPLNKVLCQKAFKRILSASPVRFIGRTAKVEPQSVFTLDRLAGVASRCPEARIEISAHTDSEGDFSENQKLTRLRAFYVKLHFIRRGVARSRLSSVGYGELRPISSNNTKAGRQKNQRLELYVKR